MVLASSTYHKSSLHNFHPSRSYFSSLHTNFVLILSSQLPPLQCLLKLSANLSRTLHTDTIAPRHPRSKLFQEAKQRNIKRLIQRGTFQSVLRSELDRNPNIVPSRSVLAIKHKDNGEEVY